MKKQFLRNLYLLFIFALWTICFFSAKTFGAGLWKLHSESPEENFEDKVLFEKSDFFSIYFGVWAVTFRPSVKNFSSGLSKKSLYLSGEIFSENSLHYILVCFKFFGLSAEELKRFVEKISTLLSNSNLLVHNNILMKNILFWKNIFFTAVGIRAENFGFFCEKLSAILWKLFWPCPEDKFEEKQVFSTFGFRAKPFLTFDEKRSTM